MNNFPDQRIRGERGSMDMPGPDILLVGKSGSGLSSTCKSLTGEEGIEVRGGWTPITPGFQIGECTTGGRTLRVVDTPGVVDENAARALLMERAVTEAFQAFPGGFHAIGLVISYSSRVTVEFADFIEDLKSILRDDDWLKKYGVVIITGGDNFHRDYKGMDMTFADWCDRQRGIVGRLLQESQFRCVLFDNVTNDQTLRFRQRQDLISLVDNSVHRERQERFVLRQRETSLFTPLFKWFHKRYSRKQIIGGVVFAGLVFVVIVIRFGTFRSIFSRSSPSER